MNYQEINSSTIDRWVKNGWEWGVPLSHAAYEAAKSGEWDVLLTPVKYVPHEWFGELKGKKVAYATGSYAQHLLAVLLDKEGLKLEDVESINLGAGDQPAALASGEVDAIVIWEQYISQLTSDGTAKVLADGTGVKRGNMITYILSDYADQNPEVVKAWIRALNRGNELLKNDPDKAAEAVAEDFGVTPELMRKIIDNFTYSTELTPDDIAEITAVKDFSLEAGIISEDVDILTFINTEYLDNLDK